MKTIHKIRVLLLTVSAILLFPSAGRSFYNPVEGRWLNRDPIEEKGGLPLYVLARNAPLAACDPLGKLALTYFNGTLTVGPCGQFSSWITWSLDNNLGTSDPNLGGAIIQYVTTSFNIHVCDKASSPYVFMPSDPINPNAWPLYEAWYIPPGNSHPPRSGSPAVDDFWTMPSFGINTKGSITITANADYFDGESIPFDFFPTYSPPTGSLPTATSFTPPGPPTSSVTRTLVATWNCCCHTENTSVTRN